MKFSANQGAVLVNGTQQGIAIQSRAPTVIQSRHNLPTPFIGLYVSLWHPGISQNNDFQPTAASLAMGTADGWVSQLNNFNVHEETNP